MHLFVVRHGIAEDAKPGQDDASRALTHSGTRKLRRSIQGVRELGWRFERVLTSPWLRATQTADLLAPVSDHSPITTELLCKSPQSELLALIAEVTAPTKKQHGTAVVGHEPWLGELVAWLAFGDRRHGDQIDFKKGGVVWLDGTSVAGGMQIRAIVTPRILRAAR